MNKRTYILLIIIAGMTCLFLIHMAMDYPGVHIDSLDRVCKELTNDERASFNDHVGAQKDFECLSDNKIVLIKKYCHYDIGEYYNENYKYCEQD